MFARYSNFHDLLRNVVWLLQYRRYLRNKCFKNIDLPPSGSLTALEFEQARLKLVKVVQQKSFPQAFAKLKDQDKFEDSVNFLQESDLRNNKELKELQALNPYLADGILRAGGRLKNATLSNNQKYPIILPKSHPVTDLVVMMHREEQGHMGTSQVLASLNKEYWIINGRSVVNRVINNCMICRLWKAKPKTQQMGDLLFHRVNESSWKKIQYLADIFWTCQYLLLLQIRKKWFGTNSNVKPGDLVLVMDESTKRGQWPKDLVQDVMPDRNGLVRRVRLRTADAQTLIRDIRKICLLEGSLV